MKRCWASSLGNCDTMSGEHIISNVVFKHGCGCPIVIEGVNRIRKGAPTYGAEKSNVLCRHHNSLLSPLDSTIGKLSKFQADANDASFNKTLFLEGELLERWLIKTIVNSGAAGWTGTKKWLPSEQIVNTIFGKAPLPDRTGLYIVEGVDPNHRPSGGASFFPIHLVSNSEVLLAGAYVSINGMTFLGAFHDDLASLLEAGVIPELQSRFSPNGLKHLHRPGAIFIDRKKGERVFIGLSWNGVLSFADGTTQPFPPPK